MSRRRPRPLRFRLLIGAALLIALALGLTGAALSALFRAHVTAQYERELTDHLNQLTVLVRHDAAGRPAVDRELSDPRFQQPYGGRYWQVEAAGTPPLRSRSLWDQALPLAPDMPAPGDLHRHEAAVPGIGRVLVLERMVRFAAPDGRWLRLAVALPAVEVETVVRSFDRLMALALGVLAAALLLGSAVQVIVGLRPLRRLARAAAAVRQGAADRLEGVFPAEVMPLVDGLNHLLAQRAAMAERARAQAADLAHGLKTALQVLLLEADALEAGGNVAGARLREQVLRMQAVVERQLARARAQGQRPLPGPGTSVAASVDAVLRVLGPLAGQRGIAIDRAGVAPDHRFAGEAGDLEEMIGNLLDNACKWASGKVRVTSEAHGSRLRLVVEDDGPGLAAEEQEAALERGRRLDERRPGSGLGLAIVRELAELHGGRVRLHRSTVLGGLCAVLDLPIANQVIGSINLMRQTAADQP